MVGNGAIDPPKPGPRVQPQAQKLNFSMLGTHYPSAVAYDCVYHILLIKLDLPAVA